MHFVLKFLLELVSSCIACIRCKRHTVNRYFFCYSVFINLTWLQHYCRWMIVEVDCNRGRNHLVWMQEYLVRVFNIQLCLYLSWDFCACVSVFNLMSAIRNCIFAHIPCGNVPFELLSGIFVLAVRGERPGE